MRVDINGGVGIVEEVYTIVPEVRLCLLISCQVDSFIPTTVKKLDRIDDVSQTTAI